MNPWLAVLLFFPLAFVLAFGMLLAARILRVRPATPPPNTIASSWKSLRA